MTPPTLLDIRQELHESFVMKPLSNVQLSITDKIALFRSFFKGRNDVYARRFENCKTNKSGYAPACGHEWIPGICAKPRIKCLDCPNRRFLPITNEVIRWHLSGKNFPLPNGHGSDSGLTRIVTPQVVDKFDFDSIKLNLRHPERSEGSPQLGSNLVNWRSFTAFRMTYLGSYRAFFMYIICAI